RRSGKPESDKSRWTVQAVKGVLTGPAASGTAQRQGKPLRDADGEPVALCEPILAPRVRQQVRRAITGTKHRAHRVDANPLLQIAFCGHCSAPLYGTTTTRTAIYYRCARHTEHRARNIPAGLLEDAVSELFLELAGHLEVLERAEEPSRDYNAEIE